MRRIEQSATHSGKNGPKIVFVIRIAEKITFFFSKILTVCDYNDGRKDFLVEEGGGQR